MDQKQKDQMYPYPLPESLDKSSWPDGPWTSEPDSESWIDTETSYPCAIIRNLSGHLCGYVRIPAEHPLHNKNYTDVVPVPLGWLDRKMSIDDDIGIMNLFCSSILTTEDRSEAALCFLLYCHGGLTYSESSWLGFDCAHSDDLTPGTAKYYSDRDLDTLIYRDFEFVRRECARLARQIWEYQNLAKFK